MTGRALGHRWQEWEARLQQESKNKKLTVHAFVLMSTHFHLLLSVKTKENLDVEFEGTTYSVNNFEQYKNSYRYIYRNPVVAGLCLRAENYPFSTLPLILGKRSSKIPVVDHMGLIVDPQKILEWINTNPTARPKYSRYD